MNETLDDELYPKPLPESMPDIREKYLLQANGWPDQQHPDEPAYKAADLPSELPPPLRPGKGHGLGIDKKTGRVIRSYSDGACFEVAYDPEMPGHQYLIDPESL